ncbi:ABC transporter permease subunit [Chitinimonas arctica]|uniref:ABC transporter permease subunit n=1 Tax=Chitinimonas arctica TaxID=2594795 RepID=UPI0015D27D9E|nr:ABC transporter permease subunit [Chitinimonas arctica]
MLPNLYVTWLAGLRSHSLRVVMILAAMLVGVAYLASSFSARHPHTVALDVGISGTRLVLALLAVFWVQELVVKELDRRTVYFSLAYPIPRSSYWLGRFAGISLLLLASTLLMALALYLLTTFGSGSYQQGFSIRFGLEFVSVMAGQLLDAMVIAAFCMLIASFSVTALLPLVAGLAFTMVARSYGSVLALVKDPAGGFADMAEHYLPLLRAIGYLLPDLGGLDLRDWVLYQVVPIDAGVAFAQSGAYLAVLLAASLLIFNRREFH